MPLITSDCHGPLPISLWSQVLTEDNYVFRQCSERFFHRAYFKGPPNMLEPLNEAAQPPAKTWLDLTLSKMMTKLDRSEEKLSKLNEKLLGPDGSLRGEAFTSAQPFGGVGPDAATHTRAQMPPAVDPSGIASLPRFIPASSRTPRSQLPHPAPSVAASDTTRSAARWLSEQEVADTSGALFAQAYPAFSTAALATALAKAENANAENANAGATMKARSAAQSSRAASNDLWIWG